MLELSIIIPTREASAAMRLIESIRAHCPRCPFEIILVDDSGHGISKCAEFQEIEKDDELNFVIIQNETNVGPATARNKGAQVARARWLLFLDSDVEVDALFFSNLIEHFDSDATIVGIYHYPQESESFFTKYYHFRLIRGYQNNRGAPVPILGAVFCMKRETFSKVGGFDERYRFASVEDIDLSKRMSEMGLEVIIDSHLQVHHHKSLSFFKLLANDYLRSRDRVHFIFRKSDLKKQARGHFDHSELTYLVSLFLPLALLLTLLFPTFVSYVLFLSFLGITISYNLRLSPQKQFSFAIKATAFVLIGYSVVWIGLLTGAWNVLLSRQKHLYGQV